MVADAANPKAIIPTTIVKTNSANGVALTEGAGFCSEEFFKRRWY